MMGVRLRERLEFNRWWGLARYQIPRNPAVVLFLCLVVGVLAGLVTVTISPMAGFALIFGALLATGILVNTLLGIVTVVTIAYLLPFAVMPVSLGGVNPTFLDASLTAVLLVWITRMLFHPETRMITTPLDGPIILFIGLALFSFTVGAYSMSGEMYRFFLKTINSLLFFFTVTNCVRERRQLEQVVRAIIWGALATAIIALILYFLVPQTSARLLSNLGTVGYPTGSNILRYIAGTKTLRAIGTNIDPNVLGGTLILALPLILAQLFGRSTLVPRFWGAIILVVVVTALALTYSRSAWTGALAATLFLAVVRYRRVWLILALLALLLYVLPQGESLVGRYQSGLAFQDPAAQMRLGEYKDAIRLIRLYPWFGVGFGSAPSVDLYVAVSSIYLLIAQEMGLVGLGFFLIIIATLFGYAFISLPHIADPALQTLQIGALAGVVGALVAGLFDHYFFNLHFPHTIALFWLFVALAVVATKLGKESEEKTKSLAH